MTFFFDNNISPKLILILKALDVEAIHLKDEFPENTEDTVWLTHVGARGWVVVTADMAIRHRPAEYAALKATNMTVLFLKSNFLQRNKWGQAEWLIRHWPKIEEQVQRLGRGTIVTVSDRGKLETLK